MDPREENLSKWARELIQTLRNRIAVEPKAAEERQQKAQQERDRFALIKAENEMYRELLDCAARGKHLTAQAIIEVLAGYSLTLTKDE